MGASAADHVALPQVEPGWARRRLIGMTGVRRACFVGLAALATALPACSSEDPKTAGKPLHAPANHDPPLPAWVACSKLIVDGTVLRVGDAATSGRMVTQLRVQDWVK